MTGMTNFWSPAIVPTGHLPSSTGSRRQRLPNPPMVCRITCLISESAFALRQFEGRKGIDMLVEGVIRGFQERVVILERVVEIFTGLLPAPTFYTSAVDRYFRYDNPDVRHFCLLKAVRIISALNASFELARKRYTQELATLMRIISECARHIEYVLDSDDSVQHTSNVQKYLREFFEDNRRDTDSEIKSVLIREKVINEKLGKTLDKIAAQHGTTEDRVPAAKLFHRSSQRFHSMFTRDTPSRWTCSVVGPGGFTFEV
jgi:hypothetical protein